MHGMIPVIIFTHERREEHQAGRFCAARVMRLSAWQTLDRSGARHDAGADVRHRLGFSLTMLGVLIGEMFASRRGLGFLVTQAMNLGDTETIMAVAVVLTAFAVTANGLLIRLGSSQR